MRNGKLLVIFTVALVTDVFGRPELSSEDEKRIREVFGDANNTTDVTNNPIKPASLNISNWDSLDDETKKKLIELFGPHNGTIPTTETIPSNRFDNTSQMGNTTRLVNPECTNEAGVMGVCVPYYLCDPDNKSVIQDGTNIIDIRTQDNICPHYLEVCCSLKGLVNKPAAPEVDAAEACGWSKAGSTSLRINDDGSTAQFGEYPWMVALLRKTEAGTAWSQNDFLGGGTLIHHAVVLTVAHKVDGKKPSELKCRAGEWDTQTEIEVYAYQERDVKKIVKHKDYFRPSVLNSIALLFLESPFTPAPHIGVACVAPQPAPPETPCETMGWGKDFSDKDKYAVILKKIELPTMERNRCQNALRTTRLGSFFMLHPSLTCAGGQKGKDVCRGDGGSPLVCPIGDKDDGRYAVFGMVAYGIGCGTEGVPGVYVNVPLFHQWIEDQMKAEGYTSTSYTY